MVVVQNGGWDAATVATLIVSVLALLAAFGSIVYARKMVRNDDARLADEQTPEFRVGLSWRASDGYEDHFETGKAPCVLDVWVELASSDPIDSMTVRLLDNVGVLEVRNAAGERAEMAVDQVEKAMHTGDRTTWALLTYEHPREIKLRIQAVRGKSIWPVLAVATVPEHPALALWRHRNPGRDR